MLRLCLDLEVLEGVMLLAYGALSDSKAGEGNCGLLIFQRLNFSVVSRSVGHIGLGSALSFVFLAHSWWRDEKSAVEAWFGGGGSLGVKGLLGSHELH